MSYSLMILLLQENARMVINVVLSTILTKLLFAPGMFCP